jgi:hypothetical protein
MKLEELKKLSEAVRYCDDEELVTSVLDHFEVLVAVAEAADEYLEADGSITNENLVDALEKLEEIK